MNTKLATILLTLIFFIALSALDFIVPFSVNTFILSIIIVYLIQLEDARHQ